ncbi:N-acetylglucosamine-6-phosphate deacetylase [Bacteroides sp.]|uniref:N-acetylglucosamine-6-phosphate deacetylase n=1 Tax=Bacteroides sp. TaxID=29523 RepID=UPI002FC88567
MNEIYQITNGQVLTPAGWLKDASVLIKEGKIAEISAHNQKIDNAIRIDAEGQYVVPGCIDMHIHGGGGRDFMEATPEAFEAIIEAHAQHGTTALLATLAVSSPDTIHRAIEVCESMQNSSQKGARILGLHLEGNYLNKTMKGAQPPEYISNPDPDEYKALLASTSCIKRWSASPELPGALAFGQYVSSRGVLVALAHTVATYPEVKEAYEAGFTHATHFYNAMTGMHKEGIYKREGTVESIFLMDDMTVEVIADGIHVPEAILRLIYKIKGVERTVLVTDAMAAAACAAGTEIDDKRVIIEDGVCKLADRSALAGSIATADRLIRTMVQDAGIPLEDAIRMTSETPARILRIADRKGTLEVGKDADIVLYNKDLHVQKVFVEGRIVGGKK